jgi:chromosome segregation ATPase
LSEQKELEKLQAMRVELEEEARLLKEEQKNLENNVLALEEKVVIEELKNRNKAAKDAIAKLEAKKKKLETKLGEAAQKSEAPSTEKEKEEEAPAQAEEVEVAKPAEGGEEGGVTITAIEGEALYENKETVCESPKKQEKKNHRFF